MEKRNQPEHDTLAEDGTPRASDAERRAILARLGKMAALTGPTMITLLMSNRASAESPQDLSADLPSDP